MTNVEEGANQNLAPGFDRVTVTYVPWFGAEGMTRDLSAVRAACEDRGLEVMPESPATRGTR